MNAIKGSDINKMNVIKGSDINKMEVIMMTVKLSK
jgi:hypothetical protein